MTLTISICNYNCYNSSACPAIDKPSTGLPVDSSKLPHHHPLFVAVDYRIMYVTLLIDGTEVTAGKSILLTSQYVKSTTADLAVDSLVIPVSSEYSAITNIYLDFISKISVDDKGEVTYPDTLPVIDSISKLLLR